MVTAHKIIETLTQYHGTARKELLPLAADLLTCIRLAGTIAAKMLGFSVKNALKVCYSPNTPWVRFPLSFKCTPVGSSVATTQDFR